MRLPGVRKFFNGISRWVQETRVAMIIKLRCRRCQWHKYKSSKLLPQTTTLPDTGGIFR